MESTIVDLVMIVITNGEDNLYRRAQFMIMSFSAIASKT